MDTGTVTRWLVHPGDAVHRGQIVAIVETDKADVEVEVFQDGIVEELLVPEGVQVEVGTSLARLGSLAAPTDAAVDHARPSGPSAGEPADQTPRKRPRTPRRPPPASQPGATHWVAPTPSEPAPAATAGSAPAPQASPPSTGPRPAGPVSPLVRRRAAELGVDLNTVAGTGKGGALKRVDVERAATDAARPPQRASSADRAQVSPRARRLAQEQGIDPAQLVGTGPNGAVTGRDVERVEPPGGAPVQANAPMDRAAAMRGAIARAMARSKREIPHYYLAQEIDFSSAQDFLRERNAATPVTNRILPAALLLKSTALAVRHTPELNGFWIDDELRVSGDVHLGVAISLRGGGLVAPAIHDADDLSIDELMTALRDLVNRARAGSLRALELSNPPIPVTNLGDQGVQVVHGAIYPPQVALVGFGSILERPWAARGMVGARPVVTGTLAADHRASDGARGALLLKRIDSLLQDPTTL